MTPGSNLVTLLHKDIQDLVSATEFLGQERAIVAALEQLQSRGAEDGELRVFEKAVRERILARLNGAS